MTVVPVSPKVLLQVILMVPSVLSVPVNNPANSSFASTIASSHTVILMKLSANPCNRYKPKEPSVKR